KSQPPKKRKNIAKKLKKQLEYFEDFDEKALKFDDFDNMINLACDVLLNLANFKSKILKSVCSYEMDSKIDEYLPKWTEWINSCTESTYKFNKFYEELSKFITDKNIKDELLFFEIQEELLDKVAEENFQNFLHIIELKSIYVLTTELECARSRFKLLDPIFVKEISDFWKELTHKLQLSKELMEIFKENECERKLSSLYCGKFKRFVKI
ncbi:128_t:CDS:2, partial [Dentiscutata erythropus]